MGTGGAQPAESLWTTYAEHCHALGLAESSVDDRLDAARAFLACQRDLATWMSRPLSARLADLDRIERAWPLVGFAILSGRIRADFDLLAARHAGRGFAAAVSALYPDDVAALRAAAARLGRAKQWSAVMLGHSLPLAVAPPPSGRRIRFTRQVSPRSHPPQPVCPPVGQQR